MKSEVIYVIAVHKGSHMIVPFICNTQRGRDSDSQGCFLSDMVVSKGHEIAVKEKQDKED